MEAGDISLNVTNNSIKGNNAGLPSSINEDFSPLAGGMFQPMGGEVLVSKGVYDVIEYIINVYVINFLFLVGSAGNIISIIILFIHGFKSSTNVILVSMAVADLLTVLTIPLRKISLIVAYFDQALSITVDSYVMRYHFLTLNRIWSLISNSHVAIISVERLLAVYFPFRVARWLTVPRMVILVVCTHVIWYVALTPMFTFCDLTWVFEPTLNTSIAIISITPFYQEREEFFNAYNSYVINISVGAALLLLTLTSCTAIAVKIIRMGKRRQLLTKISTSRQSSNTNRRLESSVPSISSGPTSGTFDATGTTPPESRTISQLSASRIDTKALKMLMAVCLSFLVLIFPAFLLAFFQGLYPKLREPYWHRVNFLATSFSMLLITINSSINFLIYVIFSHKFHTTFIAIFTCRKMNKKMNSNSSSLK